LSAASHPGESSTHTPLRRGHRTLFLGWLTLLVLGLGGFVLAGETQGQFSGAPVVLRPWMTLYNLVVAGCHFAALSSLALGVFRLAPRADRTLTGLQGAATAGFAGAALAALALAAFPVFFGVGPWPHEAPAVAWMRLLVFLPLALRAAAALALVLALVRTRPARAWHRILFALLLVELGRSLASWYGTPKAVLARVHPAGPAVWALHWTLLGVLLLCLVEQPEVDAPSR
jgi:hypothetical protein